MGQTLCEKIIARVSGRSEVRPGEVVWATPDLVTTPEVSFPAYMRGIRSAGIERLAHPERVVLVIDHEFPAQTVKGAERNRLVRKLVEELGVGHFFEGEGIAHPLVVEKGLVRPGMFVTAADTHTPALGGVGALAIPFGYELSMVLGIGRIWLQVPASIRIELHNKLQPGVTARDIIMHVMQQIGAEQSDYRVFEFCGPGLAQLSIEERMTLCNLAIDIGAKTAIAPPDEEVATYLEAVGAGDWEPIESDADAAYDLEVEIDLESIEPQVAAPPSPENIHPVSQLHGTRIDHAYIGSCASGTLSELRQAAQMLQGRRVADGVQLLVIPNTRKTYLAAVAEGLVERLTATGAFVSTPTCGPCFGGLAQLGAGEVRISTSTRNDPGRMGSPDAMIYLASAPSVVAAAIAGEICDPRDLMAPGE